MIFTVPSTLILPPIPTPPETTKAPVVGDVVFVRSETLTNPEVAAVALKFPLNISVVSTLVLGLNCKEASDESATPEAPFTGENVR